MFELTERQKEIINSPARVKLVIGGARSGKTVTAIENIWNNMKNRNNPKSIELFLVNRGNLINYSFREFKRLLPDTSIIDIKNRHEAIFVKTEYGEIIITTEIYPSIDNITIDNASSNKYANPDILKRYCNSFYITGHLPDDIDNPFFKWWLREYFSKTSEITAFRIAENFMNVDSERESDLISAIGVNKYNREYNAIPDYVDYGDEERRQQALRREYLCDFADKVENNEISFDFKRPYFMGFDKSKE